MAREILFKAKRIDNGEWVEGYYAIAIDKRGIRQHNILVADHSYGYFNWFVIDESTLCQYTGLLDKNGNKIWESDVVKDIYIGIGRVMQVKWNNHCCGFEPFCEYDNNGMKLYLSENGDCEVIGNIFDNSELLGGGE